MIDMSGLDKNDASLIRYYIVSPLHLNENRPNNLDDLDNGCLSPPSREITDELDLTNDLAMTLDSLDSLDGPTKANLFGDNDDIFGDSSAERELWALETLSLRHMWPEALAGMRLGHITNRICDGSLKVNDFGIEEEDV